MARPARRISTKSWIGVTTSGQQALGQVQAVMASIGIAEGTVRETLLRSRGEVSLAFGANAGGDSDVVGLGLIVLHSNAVSVGGSSVPGPINDIGADWLWHRLV